MTRRTPRPHNRGTNGGAARAGRSVVPAPPRRLPVVPSGWASQFRALEPGQEPRRRECANYDRCVTAYRGSGNATCPDPCARWEQPAPGPRATAYMSPDGGVRGGA